MPEIDRKEGRRLFGIDPGAYEAARPRYPERIYDVLRDRCGLGPGTRTLEIGPGTGQASFRLAALGARPLVVVEPDESLAAHLTALADARGVSIDVLVQPLESAELPDESFDLAVAASSFHWVDQDLGLAKAARSLRPGGWWAMWWNLHGDRSAGNPFHEATAELLAGMSASPSEGAHGRPRFALDDEARTAGLAAAGFECIEHEVVRWEARWDTAGIRALYSTFSPMLSLEAIERERLLDGIARIAAEQFGGQVELAMLTPIYTAQRPAIQAAGSYNPLVASRTMLPVHEAPTCSVAGAAEIVGSKWTVLLVHDLSEGPRRFTELERSCAGISPRTLAERLRWLESEEIVIRQSYPESPPRVEYALTPKGQALLPIVREMRRFGHEWLGCGVHDTASA